MEEHEHHLLLVFEKLREHQLYVKREKCAFAQQQINFFGHVIEAGKVGMEEEKVKAIKEWKTPSLVIEVRSFLGLANYYQRFVKGFSKRAEPLAELLNKRNKWSWTSRCQEAFDNFKNAMMEGPVLGIADMKKPFEVETDASDFALEGVLLQEGHPIAYESQKLKEAERRYAASEKEILAIVHCLQSWRQYLLGAKFVVKIDNSSICHFFDQPKLSSKQAC
ncbi:uncharacterized protein LOC111485000 [Cucurbita maxima]|uniref:Uncharacterized protein LOC111485000 n=1 Tax=Cucurbita maxima TaxID=3661 RepID=A0A6J1JAE8_CUCMA|nr:uncharacterized protein LOC111485000 [Cucurbita maxima]